MYPLAAGRGKAFLLVASDIGTESIASQRSTLVMLGTSQFPWEKNIRTCRRCRSTGISKAKQIPERHQEFRKQTCCNIDILGPPFKCRSELFIDARRLASTVL